MRFIGWAAIAVIADLGTKYWAVTSLADRSIVLSDWFSMMLVFNTGVAGGASIGPHTWLINVLSTVATVLLVMSVVLPLARVDRRAAMAMGLIAGGASGNLASLVGESRGVPDFLAQQVGSSIIVFNVADVALWLGAATLIPITLGLIRVIKKDRLAAAR
jgi:signal peptidase II